MKYIYPAVFYQGDKAITVYFPNLACVSQGDNYTDALNSAHEGLSLHLYGMIKDGEELPAPSKPEDIPLEENESIVSIEVDLTGFKPDWELNEKSSVRKGGKPLGWRKPEGTRKKCTLRAYDDEWQLILKFAKLLKKGNRAECQAFLDNFPD